MRTDVDVSDVPEHVDLLASGRVVRVFMEHDRISRRIEIISMCEPTNTNGNFFSLEHHRLISVVRHTKFEMTLAEGEASRPEGLQLWHISDFRDILRLRTVTQIPRWHHSFKITIAHDWSCISRRIARRSQRSLHIGQVGAVTRCRKVVRPHASHIFIL